MVFIRLVFRIFALFLLCFVRFH